MSYPSILAKMNELCATAFMMGALGAELRLQQEGVAGDTQIRAVLKDAVGALGLDGIDALEPAQRAVVIGQLTYALQEALDLIREPQRAAGWAYQDAAILQDRGRGSRAMGQVIAGLARQYPPLAAVLDAGPRFLDIGTGVAFIAIEAAKLWPKMKVTGIDIWEPALKLAASNIANEGVGDRVTLRRQSVAELDDEEAFDLVWMPSMFLPLPVIEAALPRVVRALARGGALILGTYAPPPGPFGRFTSKLLTVRSGGHAWDQEEMTARLRQLDLVDIEPVMLTSTTHGVLARKP
ncbi:MAG TPA: class I SAM-dependent methyltransferase [Stellaceae bacterium]|jgi:SAM-dependent methyltransferase|nr:class I SAM-dependent methyltransferase [Stellaceae bacterium]